VFELVIALFHVSALTWSAASNTPADWCYMNPSFTWWPLAAHLPTFSPVPAWCTVCR